MPSKPIMLLVVVLVVAGTWALVAFDYQRPPVPHFPPEYSSLTGQGGMRLAAAARGAKSPDAGRPKPQPGRPAPDANGPRDDDGEAQEIRIDRIRLTKLSAEKTVPVEDDGSPDFIIVQVDKEGGLLWNGFELGSYRALATYSANVARDYDSPTVVVAPDRGAPWKYVHWAFEVMGEAGLTDIRLGGYPRTDEKGTLLAKLTIRTAVVPEEDLKVPSDLTELVVRVEEQKDGLAKRMISDEETEDLQGFMRLAGDRNRGYAEWSDNPDYSRVPAESPWIVKPTPETAAGQVLLVLDTLRQTAVYGVRLGGDMGKRPE